MTSTEEIIAEQNDTIDLLENRIKKLEDRLKELINVVNHNASMLDTLEGKHNDLVKISGRNFIKIGNSKSSFFDIF